MKKRESYSKVISLAMVFGFGILLGLLIMDIRKSTPAPEIVEVHHTDTVKILKTPPFAYKGYRAPAFAIRGRSVVADDIIALNWQFFKTDTIAARCETPSAVYDDVILIRKFYYRGGKR